MADRDSMARMDRRKVIKSIGAGSVVGLSGVPTVSATGVGSTQEIQVQPATYRPDTSAVAGVTDAEIRINEDGSVSKELDFEVDIAPLDRSQPSTDDQRTATKFSLNLDPVGDISPNGTEAQPSPEKFAAAVETNEVTVDSGLQTQDFGLADEPSPGTKDFVSYVHTKSQECGPLARTNSLSNALSDYLYSREFEREMVEDDACEGEEWDSTFSVFCDYADNIPGLTCAVPSVFNTTWNDVITLQDSDSSSMSAGTVFTCGNFPVIPETVVSVHELDTTIDGTTIHASWGVTHGIAPVNDFSDYDLDWNGLANIIVDGLSAFVPTEAYSYVMAQFFLKDDGGIVT